MAASDDKKNLVSDIVFIMNFCRENDLTDPFRVVDYMPIFEPSATPIRTKNINVALRKRLNEVAAGESDCKCIFCKTNPAGNGVYCPACEKKFLANPQITAALSAKKPARKKTGQPVEASGNNTAARRSPISIIAGILFLVYAVVMLIISFSQISAMMYFTDAAVRWSLIIAGIGSCIFVAGLALLGISALFAKLMPGCIGSVLAILYAVNTCRSLFSANKIAPGVGYLLLAFAFAFIFGFALQTARPQAVKKHANIKLTWFIPPVLIVAYIIFIHMDVDTLWPEFILLCAGVIYVLWITHPWKSYNIPANDLTGRVAGAATAAGATIMTGAATAGKNVKKGLKTIQSRPADVASADIAAAPMQFPEGPLPEKSESYAYVSQAAEVLKKYKELLDMDIITPEQFEKKKNQLLDL